VRRWGVTAKRQGTDHGACARINFENCEQTKIDS
jgi:hypothetical protein